ELTMRERTRSWAGRLRPGVPAECRAVPGLPAGFPGVGAAPGCPRTRGRAARRARSAVFPAPARTRLLHGLASWPLDLRFLLRLCLSDLSARQMASRNPARSAAGFL